MLVGGQFAFDSFESFGYVMPLATGLVGVLTRAFEIFAKLLQTAAVDAADALLDGFDLRVEIVNR